MKFSYNWIKEHTKAKLPVQRAQEVLTAKSFEVKELIPAGQDWILDIDILPNRPDALSHMGVARELSALTDSDYLEKKYSPKLSSPTEYKIKIEDALKCPRYSALIIRDVKVGQSPKWLSERLESLGLKSINNIVDVTNYVMLATGQPLHAFDLAKTDSIVVRTARRGEVIKTLDEAQTEYNLDEEMLVIADSQRPIAIAGIKGGVATGISENTRDILVESANFSPQSIRATSRKLNLKTDASIRFSYGVDSELTATSLMFVADLIKQVASGKPDKSIIDVYPKKKPAHKVRLDCDYVKRLLGTEISNKNIASILKQLGFIVSGSGQLNVAVPSWRLDVVSQEDLIEEVARVYGYENIEARPPLIGAYDERKWVKEEINNEWDEYEFIRERQFISHLLANIGFIETQNYSLISRELKEIFGLENLWELQSPRSSDYRYLRPSLLIKLLENVRDNFRFRDEVRLFEVGRRFPFPKTETSRLAIAISRKGTGEEAFFELKGVLDLLFGKLGIAGHWHDDQGPFKYATLAGWCSQSAVAEIKNEEGGPMGIIGILHPSIAEKMKIKTIVAVAEIDLHSLIDNSRKERDFEPLPKYPAIVRDLSILVDPSVKIDRILGVIQKAEHNGIIRDIDVFDIYEPAPTSDNPNPGKSVAFHVVLRADDHTLTDGQAQAIEDEIKGKLRHELNAQFR